MNHSKLFTRALALTALTALVGSVSSPALAGDCRTNNRPLPVGNGSVDSMAMSCDSAAGAATTGVASITRTSATSFTINANLTTGVQVLSQILNGAGSPVCTISDSTPANGGQTNTCTDTNPSTFSTWRGFLNHAL